MKINQKNEIVFQEEEKKSEINEREEEEYKKSELRDTTIVFLVFCTLGGLIYQFYKEIGAFFTAIDQFLMNAWNAAPPFVQGFLITAAFLAFFFFIVLCLIIPSNHR